MKPTLKLYYFGSNSNCITIGDLVCSNSGGEGCTVSVGFYYTQTCFDQWIEVIYNSKTGNYVVQDSGYCSPP